MTRGRATLEENSKLRALEGLRKARGLTQTQLANIVKLSVSMISALENGEKSTSPANLLRLSRALGCSVEQLLVPEHEISPELSSFLSHLAPDDITDEEISALKIVRLPGRRLTARTYNSLLEGLRNSERMHS